ncbi:MAG TPA: hypothetical protein VI319_07030 [Burkholderiales bacterium]
MSDGLRLAALRLHGVAAADRDWILDRLGRRDRRALGLLLRDLKRSGIVAAHVEAAKEELAAAPERERLEPVAPGVPADLAHADPEAVARALSGEPEWVRSTILAMHHWKWRRAVLQRLAAGAPDSSVRSAPVAAAPHPAFAAALARSLARRIGETSAELETRGASFERVMDNLDPLARSPRPRIWERLRAWMR